jgi:predicted nucleic acid-binding protein
MGRYLIDSNIVSDYLAENLDNSLLDFLDPIFENQPCLSVVTQIELLSWKTDPGVENLIKQFLDNAQIFNPSDEIVHRCVDFRRSYSIKIPDALIAATASNEDLILITKNMRDFSKIKGLRILNLSQFK